MKVHRPQTQANPIEVSHIYKRMAAVVSIVLMAIILVGCSVNPATGKSQLNALSTPDEISLGEEAAPQFLQANGGEVDSPTVRQYVREIGDELASVSERPELPWEFFVIDSEQVNAFALPGGKVFVSRGLLQLMDNEAQLAAVLGHEVGHVTGQHIGQQMARQQAVGLGMAILGVFAQTSEEDWLQVLGVGAQVGGGVYLLSYGRGQETESDMLGIRYMTRLGYDPNGMVQLLQILDEASQGPRQLEWLSTHPDPANRVDDAQDLISNQFSSSVGGKVNQNAFQRNVLDPLQRLPKPRHPSQTQPAQTLVVPSCGPSCGQPHLAKL